jgi:hypothetical protein
MTNEIMSMDEIVEISQTCSCMCVFFFKFCQFCDVAKLVMIYWKI